MTKTETPAVAAPALPAIDSLSFVAADDLPVGNGPALTESEIALAAAIVTGAADGKVAVGPKVGDRKAAQTIAARMRRLVTRYLGTLDKEHAAHGKIVQTRIVPKDGGMAWGIALGNAPTPDAAPAAEGEPVGEPAE